MKKLITVLLVLLIIGILALGGWRWYDSNVDRSGWVTREGHTFYQDFHGTTLTRWQTLEGNTYFFAEDTGMVTGWQELGGSRYYFGSDGVMRTGWQDIDGRHCCFSGNGALLTGWQELDGKRYYFGNDGSMAVSWQEIDGKRHYFSGKGVLQTGWQEIDGSRYYLDRDGTPLTGQAEVSAGQYLFREDGTMVTGWADGRYYQDNGQLATGWLDIENNRYLFREDGTAVTGWLDLEEYRYYFHEDGSMAVGPTRIDGKTYHFSPHGVQIWLVNPRNEIHGDYEVELIQSEGGFRVAEVCFDAFTRMMADMRAAGLNPELASGYRTYWDQFAMYTDAVNKYGTAQGSQIAARPNTSEHHLGLAVDILVPGSNVSNKSHEMSEVQQWLIAHCWDYGFILRYPEGSTEITGIIYEPWHYRYVGQEIALELKELGITLEEYLGDWPRD